MKLNTKKALELSIEKWEWIANNNGDQEGLSKALPHLKKLWAECGLCEKYHKRITKLEHCKNCPLNTKDKGYCMSPNHPYGIWCENETKANAKAVLNLIKQKYASHLKRYYKRGE